MRSPKRKLRSEKMTNKERLEKIKVIHEERIKQNEFYTASFLHVEWLIEQAEKVEQLERKLADHPVVSNPRGRETMTNKYF